jgi:Tol biopolymer transport system component
VGRGGEANTAGVDAQSISADGWSLVFTAQASDAQGFKVDVFVRDLRSHTTALVDRASRPDGVVGNGSAGIHPPSISADGRRVAFQSTSSNLTPDDPDPTTDVFVRDLISQTTTLVRCATGRFVALVTDANDLTLDDHDNNRDVFVREL